MLQEPQDLPVPLIITPADTEAVLVYALALPPAESSATSLISGCSKAVPPVAAVDAMEPASAPRGPNHCNTQGQGKALRGQLGRQNSCICRGEHCRQGLCPQGSGLAVSCSTLAQALAQTFSLQVLPNRRYCICQLCRRPARLYGVA